MKSVTRIVLECWVGQAGHVVECEHPSEKDTRHLFDRLNGRSEDALSIETMDRGSMMVGGGPDRFVAVCFRPDGSAFHGEHCSREDGVEMLQVGGQVGDYPRHYVFDRESAWRIASVFFTTQEMCREVAWLQDVEVERKNA